MTRSIIEIVGAGDETEISNQRGKAFEYHIILRLLFSHFCYFCVCF